MTSELPSHLREVYDHIKDSPWETIHQKPNVVDSREAPQPPLQQSHENTTFMQSYANVERAFFHFVGICYLCPQIYDRIDATTHIHGIHGTSPSGVLEVQGMPGLYIYSDLLSKSALVHRELLRTLVENQAYWGHLYLGDDSPDRIPIVLSREIKRLFEGTFAYKPDDTATGLLFCDKGFLPYEVKDANTYNSSTSNLMKPEQLGDDLDGDITAVHIVSLGCDSLCVIGLEEKLFVIRLRSGDVIRFSGPSLKAWYGVAKVFEGTSPDVIADDQVWSETAKGSWAPDIQEFIKDKTINLVVKGASVIQWRVTTLDMAD